MQGSTSTFLNPIYMMAKLGAREARSSQIRQAPRRHAAGLMANPKGEIIEAADPRRTSRKA